MSTTTPDSHEKADAAIAGSPSRNRLHNWLLIIMVFIAGSTSLAIELSASRLLAPYFGTSLFVWANLIGLILLYLTIGYYVGGRVADRYPYPSVLYGMTAIAALLIGLIPVISRPILNWSLAAFATYSVSVFYGSLVAVILLFAVPMILLGCVSPFAIRLRVEQVGSSGRIAGLLYAISTAGSILGTFLPVLLLIPNIGTYSTFLVFAFTLLLISLIGFIVTRQSGGKRAGKNFLSLLLLLPLVLALFGAHGPIKPPSGTEDGGKMITERESVYNYIQVVKVGTETQLILNEGLGIHSIYDPDQTLTGGPWDYFMIAPYFNNAPFRADQVQNACVIGLGAGTIPRQMTTVYNNIQVDGVEIDSEIANLGRQYFAMTEPNLNVVVQDGRYYLKTTAKKYDIIGIDAYQQPYIPFQLTTVEFFREVRSHLTSTGVVVSNVGRTAKDYRLVDAMAQNMRTVFPNVYIIDSQRFSNSLVIATNDSTNIDNFSLNTARLTNPLLQEVAKASIDDGHIREEKQGKVFFTDDRAPIEQLIDLIIFNEVETGKK